MDQFFKKTRFGPSSGHLNPDLMIQNTDRVEPRVGPFLTPHQRKRYVKHGIVHYHLNRIRESQGVPNPYLHAWEYAKEDSIRKVKKKKSKESDKKKKDDEDKEQESKSKPISDSSDSEEESDSDEEDLREDKHKPKKEKPKKKAMPDNPLQIQAQEQEPQDKLPEMPLQDYVGKHPFRMVLSGKTGSGKSTLLTWLINNFYADYFTDIIVMAKTLKEDPVWRYAKLDPELMFEEYDPKLIEEIEKSQHDYIHTHGIATARRILVIIDDFASDTSAMRSKKLNDLFFYGRKKSISIVILTQQYNSVWKRNRENCELVVVFPTGNNAEQEALQGEQRSIFFHSGVEGNYCFDEIFRHCTTPDEEDIDEYPFMVINYQSKDKRQIYRKRLHGVITLQINPLTKMVDADFTLKGRRERAAWALQASRGQKRKRDGSGAGGSGGGTLLGGSASISSQSMGLKDRQQTGS